MVVLAVAMAAATAAVGSRQWSVGPVLLHPGANGNFDSVAVKDPSIVRYRGVWHLFYTARDRTEYSLGYITASRLEGFDAAPRHALEQLRGVKSRYAAAPQIFYFEPQKKWYLIFQTADSNYQPVYSTSASIGDPASWSAPRPLVEKHEGGKWIDFWVLCDERQAYLFYTREHREMMMMTARLDSFPSGFSSPRVVFSPVHEAAHVYAVQGSRPLYVMLYEKQQDGLRRFGLARATSPAGPWTVAEASFASGGQLVYLPGRERWTDEVSHGELLRAGYDQRLEISPDQWEFLVQGMPAAEHRGDYPLLPWRLGLLRSPGGVPAEIRALRR